LEFPSVGPKESDTEDTVIFNGRKCVSDEAGHFPPKWQEKSTKALGIWLNTFNLLKVVKKLK
jgi:hypothetical protein